MPVRQNSFDTLIPRTLLNARRVFSRGCLVAPLSSRQMVDSSTPTAAASAWTLHPLARRFSCSLLAGWRSGAAVTAATARCVGAGWLVRGHELRRRAAPEHRLDG